MANVVLISGLKLKVEAWQRIIRGHFQTQYNRSVISNPTVKAKTFNMYTEPKLAILTTTLDQEMRTSAAMGLSSGMVKRRRSSVTPADLKKSLQLWDLYRIKISREAHYFKSGKMVKYVKIDQRAQKLHVSICQP